MNERINIIHSSNAASILGAEPFPTTTYALDIPSGGVLKPGTFITRWSQGNTAATVLGDLGAEGDATAATKRGSSTSRAHSCGI